MQKLIENKSKIFSRNAIICLGIIGLVGFLIRFFYFPDGIPITLDGTLYFWYANDLSISGTFPANVNMPNNGWPTFSFFLFFQFREFFGLHDAPTIYYYNNFSSNNYPSLYPMQKVLWK